MSSEPVLIAVAYDGTDCGQAQLVRDGLYTALTCRCGRVSEKVLRAYATTDGQPFCLGVLAPEQGQLCLSRRIPAARLDPTRVQAIYLSDGEEPAWMPWQGTLEGFALAGYARMEQGRRMIAVAYDPSQPLPQLRLYAAMTPLWLEGKLYLAMNA